MKRGVLALGLLLALFTPSEAPAQSLAQICQAYAADRTPRQPLLEELCFGGKSSGGGSSEGSSGGSSEGSNGDGKGDPDETPPGRGPCCRTCYCYGFQGRWYQQMIDPEGRPFGPLQPGFTLIEPRPYNSPDLAPTPPTPDFQFNRPGLGGFQ